MKIIVLTRQVKIKDASRCDFAGIEAAVRLKEQTGCRASVYVLGEEKEGVQQVRDAIAMGLDDGKVIVADDLGDVDMWSCAKIFAKHIGKEKYDIIISGGFPSDADTVPLGLVTAGLLGIPALSHVESIRASEEEGAIEADRRREDRLQILKIKLPCLLSALPHPEAPIYKTVAGINRAYDKEIEIIREDGQSTENRTSVIGRLITAERKRGRLLTAVSTEEAVAEIIGRMTEQHIL